MPTKDGEKLTKEDLSDKLITPPQEGDTMDTAAEDDVPANTGGTTKQNANGTLTATGFK